jgi:hypothetical protein
MRIRRDRCERVRAHLPALVAVEQRPPGRPHRREELPRWRRKLVERHVAKCVDCADELARQRQVAERLARMRERVEEDIADTPVPEDLLDSLLEQAGDPGLRARAAVPARGAISGARPDLTAALVIMILALVATAAWAGWRLGRALSARR